jgi:ribosomal protein S18 acetylase RimI-like enzyme
MLQERQNIDYIIRQMTIGDYDYVCGIWEQTEGLSLEETDTQESIAIYLNRNRGLCFVACVGDQIVGTVLCGHEGRRGILRHLAVKKEFRRNGIARALINECLSAPAKEGIKKCNAFVEDANVEGRLFWDHMGWYVLEDNFRTMQVSIRRGGQTSRPSG